ncbi:MAG: DUF881 domain-containing protein [Clostridia bacterium]|nr:DUF881 domain-containing protein [Clostridia bacterium]
MNRNLISLILGLMCFFLTIGIVVQIKSVESSKTVVAKTTAGAELRDNILRVEEKYNETLEKLNLANMELEGVIEQASQKGNGEINYSDELKKMNKLLGYSDVEGQGLVVTVQDGDPTTVKGPVSNYLVHDGDLINIVSLLRNAGAEAISINDERIVSNTAITCAGNIVIINGKKVGSPFVINAIGLTEKLYGAVTITDNLLKNMDLQGVKVSITKKEKLRIKKYSGVYTFNYAKNVD